jgi:hypothetical protein
LCVDQIAISRRAHELRLADFQDRVPQYIARFRQLQTQPPRPDPACTFKPAINHGKYSDTVCHSINRNVCHHHDGNVIDGW